MNKFTGTVTAHFTPSSWQLDQMIASAMAKCDADAEQHAMRRQAIADARYVRGEVAAAQSRHYRRIQLGY